MLIILHGSDQIRGERMLKEERGGPPRPNVVNIRFGTECLSIPFVLYFFEKTSSFIFHFRIKNYIRKNGFIKTVVHWKTVCIHCSPDLAFMIQ